MQNKSKLGGWLLFFGSTALFFILLQFKGELCCWALPGVTYGLVKGLDII